MFLIWPEREREKERKGLYISLLEKLYSKIMISHRIQIFFYFEAYRRESAAASGYDRVTIEKYFLD